MKARQRKALENRRRKQKARLKRKAFKAQSVPMLRPVNIRYEVADKVRATQVRGLGVFHKLAERVGLIDGLNAGVPLFVRHLPYFESDHVLTLAYNVLAGGTCLEDIRILRQDVTLLDALEAERIPHPTTVGDFTRRFDQEDILSLMGVLNHSRVKVWKQAPERFDES